MKTRTKALLLTLCAVLLVTASVMGTMAYLTSNDSVTNTFTVGQVKITLDEAKVGDDGKALTGDDAARVNANTYKLMPGHSYDKDPTVTVKAGSEESYVRLLVTATFDKELTDTQLATKLDGIFTGYSSDWSRPDDPGVTTVGSGDDAYTVVTYEYRYKTTVTGASSEDTALAPLFTGVEVPDTWTNDDLKNIGGVKIEIVAQAIQKDGFDTADAAWAKFPTTDAE